MNKSFAAIALSSLFLAVGCAPSPDLEINCENWDGKTIRLIVKSRSDKTAERTDYDKTTKKWSKPYAIEYRYDDLYEIDVFTLSENEQFGYKTRDQLLYNGNNKLAKTNSDTYVDGRWVYLSGSLYEDICKSKGNSKK